MSCCPGTTVDPPIAQCPAESLFEFGTDEALKHKWIRSYHAGCDLGERAIWEWVEAHWHTFLRARWVEHLEGRRFWHELYEVDFGLLRDRFHDSPLFQKVFQRLKTGEENLMVYKWALDTDQELAQVTEILEAVNVNGSRLMFQFEPRPPA